MPSTHSLITSSPACLLYLYCTSQVVGHAKTCLVLVGGYMLFPAKEGSEQQFYNNIAGVAVTRPNTP